MNPPAPRVLFYVQHLLGIGHLIRASRVADALAHAGFQVTIVTGGRAVPGFPGTAVRHVALAPLQAGRDGFATLCDASGAPAGAALLAARKDQLLRTLHDTAPDIIITEAFPFGRRQMRFELLPLLEAARARAPRPLVVCSIRDILQAVTKPGRAEETADIVDRFYDLVLVHGDPRFAGLEETFPLADRFADRIAYTGLVAGPPCRRRTGPFDVIVSAGGGAVGADLLQAALLARPATRLRAARWLMVAGPNLPPDRWDALAGLAPSNVELSRFRADLPQLLAGAQVSLSQAGYNTVCDLLRARVKAVLVPFAAGGETEQSERARRLAERGLAVTVAPDALSGAALDQDDFGLNRAKIMNLIDSDSLERDAGGTEGPRKRKPVSTFPHPALEHIPLKSNRFERQEYAQGIESGAISYRSGDSTRSESALAQAIETALDLPAPRAGALDLDGAAATAKALAARIGSRAACVRKDADKLL